MSDPLVLGRASIQRLTAGHPNAMAYLRELEKFRNGIDNILAALKAAPGLPIESLSSEDQAKWTDTITGILMALGAYEATGKPVTVWDALKAAK